MFIWKRAGDSNILKILKTRECPVGSMDYWAKFITWSWIWSYVPCAGILSWIWSSWLVWCSPSAAWCSLAFTSSTSFPTIASTTHRVAFTVLRLPVPRHFQGNILPGSGEQLIFPSWQRPSRRSKTMCACRRYRADWSSGRRKRSPCSRPFFVTVLF